MSKILFSAKLYWQYSKYCFAHFDISEYRIRNNDDQFLRDRLVPAWESSCSHIIELRTQCEDTIVRIETVIKGQGLSLGSLIIDRINSSLSTVNGGMYDLEREIIL